MNNKSTPAITHADWVKPKLTRSPSQTIRDQVHATFQHDAAVVLNLGHRVQAEHVLRGRLVTIETVDAGYTAHWLFALDQRTSDGGWRSEWHEHQVCS